MMFQVFFPRTPLSVLRRTAGLPLLALAFVLVAPLSAQAETPAAYMQRVQNELMAAQRAGSIAAFTKVLRSHMDVPSIGLTALGPHAKSLPRSERPLYYKGMINFIAKYSAKESPKYVVTRAVVTGQGQEAVGGVEVDSHITLASGEGYDIRWKVVHRGSTYKVRDAQVIGFWMTSFLDNLFQNYISENGNNPRALVMALNR